jgi:hypothetical protein
VQDSTITDNITSSGGAGAAGTGGQGSPPFALGGDGRGGAGGAGGQGAGIASAGPAMVIDTTISGNTAGAGGAGGAGGGGSGGVPSCPCDGGSGGKGFGGPGGPGGFGGGVAVLGNAIPLDGSLIRSNATGPGGSGGAGEGGGGRNGDQGGNGGAGGAGNGGLGGEGGGGGGVAERGGNLVSGSDTIVGNTTAGGGEGGIGAGGPAGNGGFASDGGSGSGGTGGEGGVGGGVFGGGGAGTLTQATIANNQATSAGGAGGTAFGGFGGTGSTHNGADGAHTPGATSGNGTAGGVYLVTVRDSLLVGNLPVACTFASGSLDIEFPGTSCPGAQYTDPGLGLLADHGGPTLTYALSPGSPAVDHVPSAGSGCVPTDQRGVPRPQGAACDAGAYELAPPAAATGAVTPGITTAALTGTVNPHFRAASTHFEYGATSTYGSATVDQPAGAGNADAPVSATLTGLAPGTTYHVRLVASNADGAAQGADVSFTTSTVKLPPPPLAPVLSKLTLKPATFRVAPVKHPRRNGAQISYQDTRVATTTFSVEQRRAGVRKGKRCVAPPSHAHGKKPKRCTRYVLLKGSFSHADSAGANKLRFSGVLGGTRLARGSYRLRARPRAGNLTGQLVRKAFEVR